MPTQELSIGTATVVPAIMSPRPRFYLVGEAERSHRRPATEAAGRTSICVNGSWHALRGKSVTFEQLLRIAFPHQPLANPSLATVTYRRGVAPMSDGILTPGDVIPLADGLLVNANATYAS